MTTIAHLMYASPAWWGYTSAEERERIERLLRKMKRRQYLLYNLKPEMAEEADERLFNAIRNNKFHVLYQLFPPPRPSCGHELRPRAHEFSLPEKDNCNFIPRVLFKNTF